mmetsp:Transcript_44990/g.109314  ORF Transcript_44990/g.109314 Transcript_44990/m.109314 type:complete len:248 (+) Transcript_44990:1466-2209(+)
MLCSTLSTSSSSSKASMISMFFSKSSSEHSTGALVIYDNDILDPSSSHKPASLIASNMVAQSLGSTRTIVEPSSSPSSTKKSSTPASMATSNNCSSSRTESLFASILPFRSYMKRTEPCSAIFPLRLLTVLFTSALALFALSVNTLITNDAPPRPYASNVDSEKSPTFASVARLIARLILSTGTLLALAALMMLARARLEFGSGEPPVLTAIIIFFPNTAFVLALAASVFPFVAARTAAARPINSWK